MKCQELADFLSQYIGKELPEDQVEIFEEHLERCGHCVDYVESYRATIRLGKVSMCHEDDLMPKEVPQELIRAILDARKRGGA